VGFRVDTFEQAFVNK